MNQTAKTQKDELNARVDRMTRVLRALGALLLLTSASSFLIHRWDAGNDLLRYGFLLAHSFVILGAALFCGGKLGESRSARLFLWTNLALVPTHFAVLGGLVYSQFALDANVSDLPKYAVWVAPDRLSVLLAAAGAFLTTIPTSLISARVLAPRRVKVVTLSFVGLCSLLLVPLRAADGIAVLAAAGAIFGLYAERKWFSKDYRTRTWEGRLVRALMAVPVLMLVGRTAAFYDTSSIFTGLLVMVVGLCGWVATRSSDATRATVEAGEWLSVIVGSVGTIYVLAGCGAFDSVGPLCLLAVSGLLFLAARFSQVTSSTFETAAAVSGLFICGGSLAFEPTLLEGTLAIAVGTAAVAHSILLGRALLGTLAAVTALAGVAIVFDQAIGFERVANWGALSALGILVVIAAAVLERHRESIVERVLSRMRQNREATAGPIYGPLPYEKGITVEAN